MPFYLGDLNIHGFWYPPENTKGNQDFGESQVIHRFLTVQALALLTSCIVQGSSLYIILETESKSLVAWRWEGVYRGGIEFAKGNVGNLGIWECGMLFLL